MFGSLDSETLQETARALAEEIPSNQFEAVRATLVFIHHAERELTPGALQDHSPCEFSDRAAEVIVYRLRTEKVLTNEDLDEAALDAVFTVARLLAAQDPPPENTVVATLPYDDRAFDEAALEALHENMLALIQSASNDLVLLSPFLSEQAYERLRPALHTAAGNGAALTVITRYLTYGDDEDMADHNRAFVNRVMDDATLAHRTRCCEYRNRETWTTFHAKVVLADDHTAYLGTANLTATGLGGNLELGVVFRDGTVGQLADIVRLLKTSDHLHRVKRVADREFAPA
jgi:phosphatidylserine/phosphatidylglycerophosphate/cardiolipin synthase-like enzyme